MPRFLGVIPARLHSTRLPRKVLLPIAGRPMIELVYRRAQRCDLLDDVLVATDSEEVAEVCRERHINVMLTGEHPSGSDRLYEVMTRTDAEFYINIQGDEPMVTAEQVNLLARPFVERSGVLVTTLCTPISAEEAEDPNSVKVVRNDQGFALYFSRSRIPYDRDAVGTVTYWKHLGLYGFRRETLHQFHSQPQAELEKAEKLEQLRLLASGIPIFVSETPASNIGVDTEEDLARVEQYFRERPEELA